MDHQAHALHGAPACMCMKNLCMSNSAMRTSATLTTALSRVAQCASLSANSWRCNVRVPGCASQACMLGTVASTPMYNIMHTHIWCHVHSPGGYRQCTGRGHVWDHIPRHMAGCASRSQGCASERSQGTHQLLERGMPYIQCVTCSVLHTVRYIQCVDDASFHTVFNVSLTTPVMHLAQLVANNM